MNLYILMIILALVCLIIDSFDIMPTGRVSQMAKFKIFFFGSKFIDLRNYNDSN